MQIEKIPHSKNSSSLMIGAYILVLPTLHYQIHTHQRIHLKWHFNIIWKYGLQFVEYRYSKEPNFLEQLPLEFVV